MGGPSRTSVIVCTYNDERLPILRVALRATAAQDPAPDEIVVVVDHNSPLAASLAEELPHAVVRESTGPKGLSGARNTGVEMATGDVVVFLDDDAVPRPGWLAGLLAPLGDPSVAGVGGKAEPAWETGERPAWLPPELDWVVGCSFEGQATGDVRNPIGCSMAFRSSVLAEVGGFATALGRVGTLPLGCEETELGLRVNRSGGRIVLVEDSIVDHFVPHTRASVGYVLRRCWSEGISKAAVRRLASDGPGPAALDPERRYVASLLRGMVRAVPTALRRRDLAALAPIVLIPLSGLVAAAGFVRGNVRRSG